MKNIEFINNYKFDVEIEGILNKQDSTEKDFQLYATYSSLKGNHKNALVYWDQALNTQNQISKTKKIDINRFIIFSAKDYIIESSKNYDIVIINESHHNSSHRVFLRSTLKGLFENGYKTLCLEALNNSLNEDSLINKRKYAYQTSGFYTRDPQYGNLIRTAIEIGFKIYGYETSNPVGGEVREAEQTKNIRKIIDGNKESKVLVYCGSGHALEGEVDFFGGRSLAGRIKDIYGIDVLTVDQVFYSEKSKAEYSNSISKAINIKKPSVLIDSIDNKVYSYKNENKWIDVVVFHPTTEYIKSRPNWLFNFGNKLTEIKLETNKMDFPIMIMAFLKSEEFKKAIPYDIVEIKEKKDDKFLMLNQGEYHIVITNLKGEVITFDKIID